MIKNCKQKECCVCGKRIKAPKHVWKMHKYFFDGWAFTINEEKLKKCKLGSEALDVVYKNKFWKIIAYTKAQRAVIYFIWKITFGVPKIELYECDKCYNRPDDSIDEMVNLMVKTKPTHKVIVKRKNDNRKKR